MTSEPTVYYLTVDSNEPIGGVRVMYRHVDILRSSGVRSFIVHKQPGFKCTWFKHDTPVTSLDQIDLASDSVLVIPEVFGPEILQSTPGMKKVVFNQSGYLTFGAFPLDAQNVVYPYRHPDVVATLAISDNVASYLDYAFPGTRLIRVRPSVDPGLFRYCSRKKAGIAFMPRRNAGDLQQVLSIVRVRGEMQGFALMPIQGVGPDMVARILSDAAIFLALGTQEGFGLPALEAMASGCIVVGYHGMGGREFLKPEFSFPVDAGDVIAFAKSAAAATELVRYDEYRARKMGAAASEFARETYSPEHEAEDVRRAWAEIIG